MRKYLCVCVFAVCLPVQRGKGGQVFALTRFNEGSVCFCVCACVCAPLCVNVCLLLCVCVSAESTHLKDMDGWMEVVGFFITCSSQVPSFTICRVNVCV